MDIDLKEIQSLDQLFEFLNEHFGANAWMLKIFVVVLLTALVSLVFRLVAKRLRHKFDQTKNIWDDALIEALRLPLSFLIWVQGLSLCAEIVVAETETVVNGVFEFADPVRYVSSIFAIAWFCIRSLRLMEERIICRNAESEREDKLDRATVEAIGKLLRLVVVITATIVILQTLGFSLSGVLAFGGIGGIAVGFAAKDLLANFFGGLMIYLDRPFAVGDWVRSPDRSIEGTVEYIGWRLTRIRTFDQRPLYVPNSVFTAIAVENPSRMSHRRIYETIGIRYDDLAQMQGIVAEVEQMLRGHEEIDERQTLMVNFNAFAASSLDFFIYAFTHTTNWVRYHGIKQDVLLGIAAIIERHGAEIAYPTSTLYLNGEAPPALARAATAEGVRSDG